MFARELGSRTRSSQRVLVLAHVFPRSLDDSMGAFLLHLADALAPCGVSTIVLAPHAPGLADEETLGAARVHRFHYAPARWERLAYTGTMHELVAGGAANQLLFGLFNLVFLFKTLRLVRATRPDVLHAHWWLPDGLVGALAALVTRVPLVVTTHGTDVEMLRRKRWAAPFARFVFSRARVITCGSTYLRDQLLALRVADARRVVVLPMPVNPIFEIGDWRSKSESGDWRLEIPSQDSPISNLQSPITNYQPPISLLVVARLTKQKSIDTCIEALGISRGRGRTVRLVVIGDGPERNALEEQARHLGLQDSVEFLGTRPQSELPDRYANCGAFVLPSVREGMGLVLAEALLCGAPVIAANSGGIGDIVRDGETGLLVPERNPVALADAIDKLLNDRSLAARLAENGRAWVQERYTPAGVAERFAEVYRTAGGS